MWQPEVSGTVPTRGGACLRGAAWHWKPTDL